MEQYVKVKLKFSLKEEMELSSLQYFLLNSIHKYNASVDDFADATLLNHNFLKEKLEEMVTQKLLYKDNNSYKLTNESKQLISLTNFVENINLINKYFYFNIKTKLLYNSCEKFIDKFESLEIDIDSNQEFLLNNYFDLTVDILNTMVVEACPIGGKV